jgi:hypothetical protein
MNLTVRRLKMLFSALLSQAQTAVPERFKRLEKNGGAQRTRSALEVPSP